jgi:glycosyltransferase involved in cell wall biosynthesis
MSDEGRTTSKLIVHTESSLGWGGQEIRILEECRELVKIGFRIVLIVDKDSQIAHHSRKYSIETRKIPLKKKGVVELFGMIKALNALSPEFVFTHSSTDHWIVALARLLTKKTPIVVRTRHVSTAVHRNLFTRWLYNCGADAVITTGEVIKKNLISDGFLPVNKVRSIPTGIDLKFFCRTNRQFSRQTLGVSDDVRVFCNVATLRSWKGQDYLIQAFAGLSKFKCRLIIVGDGPMMSTLQTLVSKLDCSDSISLVGQQDDVRPYLDAADMFIFPSFANEGVPQAILQAMAYSLPIVTTKAGGIPEAVANYPAVKFVQKRDVSSLRTAMLEYLESPARVTAETEPAVSEAIGLQKMTQRVVEVISSATKAKKPSLSVYLIGDELTPSSRRRYFQYEESLLEKFQIRRYENTNHISAMEVFLQPKYILLQKTVPRLVFWLLLRPFLKSRIVFDFDDALWEKPGGIRSKLAQLRFHIRFSALKTGAAKLVAPSEYLLRESKASMIKGVKIPMAIRSAEVIAREDFFYPKERQIILGWAGHPQSHYLIESINAELVELFSARGDIRFMVLSGKRPKLNCSHEWIDFSLANEKKFFHKVDIGLVPMSESGFDSGKSPIKIIQHFASGATVIYSGNGAVAEICNASNSYRLADFRELPNLITKIFSNKAELVDKQKAALKDFRQRFAAEKIGTDFFKQVFQLE